MPLKQKTHSDPNVNGYDGAPRVFHVPFAAGTIFQRRGGKAVDLHHRYQAATANSSNLAGFAEVDVVGVTDGHPASIADGDDIPVNMGDVAAVFPTTGRVAVEADRGKDFDIYVDGTGKQYINMSATSKGVLRVSRIIDESGAWVSVVIPEDLKYGNI